MTDTHIIGKKEDDEKNTLKILGVYIIFAFIDLYKLNDEHIHTHTHNIMSAK